MEKEFSAANAKELIGKYDKRVSDLNKIIQYVEKCRNTVGECIDDCKEGEVQQILEAVPVDELNKAHGKIRVSALKQNGYQTIADLLKANTSKLANIDGISSDGAGVIRRLARDFYEKASQQIGISLNADKRDEKTTRLVHALARYRRFKELQPQCEETLAQYGQSLHSIIEKIRPATSTLKWLFTSKAKKEEAQNAYVRLAENDDHSFLSSCVSIISKANEIARMDDEQVWLDFSTNTVEFNTLIEKIGNTASSSLSQIDLLPSELAEDVSRETLSTEGLNCNLRSYQETGVKYILHQKKVLLGDEMGLGKTVQAIASMVCLRNKGEKHFVVVCPASVVVNWNREVKKFSDLPTTLIHGSGKNFALLYWIKNGGVALTTYETASVFDSLDRDFEIGMIVVDEAHYVKNDTAQRTKAVKALCRHGINILFMSGTPLENRVEEMIALVDILQPQLTESLKAISFMPLAQQFRDKIAPVYYRRKREDVLKELPQLVENEEWCTLTTDELKQYREDLNNKSYMSIRRLSWNMDDLSKSSKAARLQEIVEEAESEGRKVIVFSFFLDTVNKICAFLGDRCTSPINGSLPAAKRQAIIDEFEKNESKTVLPAQIQSGGTGLNIQCASVVIICEPQLKPSIENQAISRCYRMGQSRSVLVYRLLGDDTIDEEISKLLKEKQNVFNNFADKSAVAGAESELAESEIDEKSFKDIVEEEIKRLNLQNRKNNETEQNTKEA